MVSRFFERAAVAAAGALACIAPPAAPAETPHHAGPPGTWEVAEPDPVQDPAEEGADEAAPVEDPTEVAAEPARAGRADLTPYEAGVAAALNRMRRDPAGFAGALERHRRRYEQNYLYLPGVDAPILTAEGVAAVDEAIAAARRARPRPELRVSPGLSRAARAHATEIGRAGTVEHGGRDGSQPHQRMERHGQLIGLSGENIGTGWGDAATMVMSLFIDDGVPGRGHRVNMLEPKFRVVGVGCARHKRFGTVCVFDFAGGFRE